MKTKYVSQIVQAGKVIFGVNSERELFFDGHLITKIPKSINIDSLMSKLKDDTELNKLVDQYYKVSYEVMELEKKEKEITRQIDLEVLDALVLELKHFNSKEECQKITKDYVKDKVIYKGKHFSIVTTETDVDLSCYVERLDKEIGEIDPEVFIEINHDDRSIGVFIDGYIVYLTTVFKFNAFLSYLKDLIFLGKLQQFIYDLKSLKSIEKKQGEQVELYEKVRKHVLKSIKELSDA